jgi:hypothetical protein
MVWVSWWGLCALRAVGETRLDMCRSGDAGADPMVFEIFGMKYRLLAVLEVQGT